LVALNHLDKPINLISDPAAGDSEIDHHLDLQSARELQARWEFFRRYTTYDYSDIDIIYGGFAAPADSRVGPPAVTMGNAVSLGTGFAPTRDGRLFLDAYAQGVVAFHETTHVLQQLIYGGRNNSAVAQLLHSAAGHTLGRAYQLDNESFDRLTSIHDLGDHWEQQAELMEQALVLLYSRFSQTSDGGSSSWEAFPGDGQVLYLAGSQIDLNKERWTKVVGFVKEFGDSAGRALKSSGGRFKLIGTRTRPT